MVATRRLKELVSATLSKLELPDAPVVVALSGGADSASLAMLTLEAGLGTRALHIDHQLAASPQMSSAADEVASRLGIPVEVRKVAVGEGPSPEDQAREARYSAFEKTDGPILTAHTRDDSVETMLINLIRGTGPAGLTGIPRFRPPHVHRPMVTVTRSETREIATLAGLPFVDDPMNDDMSLTRNRVRLTLLPLIRELNPQFDAAIARTASAVDADVGYLESLVPALADNGAVPVSMVSTLPRALADRLLRRALEEAGLTPTADRISRMWSVATKEAERQDLAGGRSAVRRGALIVVE